MIKNDLHKWFTYLFDERKDKNGFVKCFECGKPMHEDTYKNMSICYSHILSKKKYPDLKGDPANLVIVHPNCHNLYTVSPLKASKQHNLYKILIENYNL